MSFEQMIGLTVVAWTLACCALGVALHERRRSHLETRVTGFLTHLWVRRLPHCATQVSAPIQLGTDPVGIYVSADDAERIYDALRVAIANTPSQQRHGRHWNRLLLTRDLMRSCDPEVPR